MAENKDKKQENHVPKIKSIVGTRGRNFEGYVVKKFPTRVVIEYEKTTKVHKYERFFSKTSRIHARLPTNMDINIGDYVKVQECRPLSKIIHHVVIQKIKSVGETK